MKKNFLMIFLLITSISFSDEVIKNEISIDSKEIIEVENKNIEIKNNDDIVKKQQNVEEYLYIEKYINNDVEYTLNIKIDKHFNEELNHYVYIKHSTGLRRKPSLNDKIIKKLSVGQKIGTKALIKAKDGSKWYEIIYNNEIYYIPISSGIKRSFDWQRAIEKSEIINDFIKTALYNNKEIYYLDSYVSLNTLTDGKKDKFGNPANQSIKAYYNNNKEYINLPDRALFTIESIEGKYINIKTMSYGDEIYKIPISYKNRLKKSNITDSVNKFIYIDRHSQTEVVIEKNIETQVFNVNTVGYVTTGIEKGVGFVTPYGDFLVAYTKPVMSYASDNITEDILNSKGEVIGKKPIIIGDAKNAIRFTGGGYIHGIPSTYEPKGNREARKKVTASKLGTVPLSHKCVRNDDDIVKYIYDWINGSNKIQRNGFTYPIENVIVIVE